MSSLCSIALEPFHDVPSAAPMLSARVYGLNTRSDVQSGRPSRRKSAIESRALRTLASTSSASDLDGIRLQEVTRIAPTAIGATHTLMRHAIW